MDRMVDSPSTLTFATDRLEPVISSTESSSSGMAVTMQPLTLDFSTLRTNTNASADGEGSSFRTSDSSAFTWDTLLLVPLKMTRSRLPRIIDPTMLCHRRHQSSLGVFDQ